jgi:hypothetical protein
MTSAPPASHSAITRDDRTNGGDTRAIIGTSVYSITKLSRRGPAVWEWQVGVSAPGQRDWERSSWFRSYPECSRRCHGGRGTEGWAPAKSAPVCGTRGKVASVLPGSASFVLVVARMAGGCGERAAMIAAGWCDAGLGCSPYRLPTQSVGWVHSTGVNGDERSPVGVRCQVLTCRNGVWAGQPRCPGNFDTEEVTGSIPVSPTR